MFFFFNPLSQILCQKPKKKTKQNKKPQNPPKKKISLSQVTYVQDTTLKCGIHVETKHLGACWKNSGDAVELLQACCHSDSLWAFPLILIQYVPWNARVVLAVKTPSGSSGVPGSRRQLNPASTRPAVMWSNVIALLCGCSQSPGLLSLFLKNT